MQNASIACIVLETNNEDICLVDNYIITQTLFYHTFRFFLKKIRKTENHKNYSEVQKKKIFIYKNIY